MAKPFTRKRRRRWAAGDTWDTANAKDFRRLNEPVYRTFRPGVQLDPSAVDDQRSPVGLLGEIARWWGGHFGAINPINKVRDLIPPHQYPADTAFGQLQRSYRAYQAGQPQPGPAPSPSPSKIANPGLLSKYRR